MRMTALKMCRPYQTRLLLASESPRRRALLAGLVKEFTVEASAVEEIAEASDMSPLEIAAANAAAKADAVAQKNPADWVLGADTVVVLDNKVYGKPRNTNEAREFLMKFSSRTHEVVTAVALRNIERNVKDDFASVSQVKFRKLDAETVEKYLALVPVLDKAGAYGIQDHGDMLVDSVEGEIENIIGLPVKALAEHFKQLDVGSDIVIKQWSFDQDES